MKYGTHCWDNFTSMLEAYYEVVMKEGEHFKVLGSKEIVLLEETSKQFGNLMEFYYDAWLAALDTQEL
uniref:Uncharacterized protein n=1 Tax=Vibrio phage P018-4 TaxID=3229728 RepID=A0AB39AJW9_9CAUD